MSTYKEEVKGRIRTTMWTAVEHYDATVRPDVPKSRALAERAAGPSAAIKRYHNDVKRRLIDIFARGAPRYLDVACGRGGDVAKWIRAGVGFVRGIDVSPAEIEEARRRYAAVRPPPRKTTCVFEVVHSPAWFLEASPAAASVSSPATTARYDVVACMFAVHYFFESRDLARSFFSYVASVLEPGTGLFIGTFPDGHRVLEAAALGDHANLMMSIRLDENEKEAYTIRIVDTVVDRDGSREFLVFPETLMELAAEAGLEPVVDYADIGTLLDPRDRRQCIRHFASRHPDPDVRAVSALFATFAFRKPQNSRMSAA